MSAKIGESVVREIDRITSRARLARTLRSAAAALEHGRNRSAREKVEKVFDELAPEPLVIEISGGVLQGVYTIRDARAVGVEHALVDWDVLCGDGADQVTTARVWNDLPDLVRWYLEQNYPRDVEKVREIISPPPPPPQPESLADAARNALDIFEYTLSDCADDDRQRMQPAADRLRAALTRSKTP